METADYQSSNYVKHRKCYLSKLRHFINRKTSKAVYHAIVSSLVWIQTSNLIKDFLFYKRNPYDLYIYLVAWLICYTYSKNPTFLNCQIKLL